MLSSFFIPYFTVSEYLVNKIATLPHPFLEKVICLPKTALMVMEALVYIWNEIVSHHKMCAF
jgi:hypothetical protein